MKTLFTLIILFLGISAYGQSKAQLKADSIARKKDFDEQVAFKIKEQYKRDSVVAKQKKDAFKKKRKQ